MPPVELAGCAPEPLMSYLKALGVFRILAEQVDSTCRLGWKDGRAFLETTRTPEEVHAFLLNDYRPTPILAPWNGGSGFYGGGSDPLMALEQSDAPRVQLYRETIRRIRGFAPKAKPKDEQKDSLLVRCRSELDDDVVPWLDACYVLGENGPKFFPLLGTGGNDGRLEFTNNFMQRLAEVIPLQADSPPPRQSTDWLRASLFSDGIVGLGKTAIGQFNPGGIGGPNGTQGAFEADSRVNPWDYVLMIEGTLLLAGSVARRMGVSTSDRAAFPFSVESVAVGYGSASFSEETSDGSRAEVWLPLWSRGCTLSELQRLFAEGRAQLGRRQARNAVDFALAVCMLGVSRGIEQFVRYGFLKRNGLAFLATPLGRVDVQPRAAARVLDDVSFTLWLESLRRACREKDKTPQRYQAALRNLDRAIYSFACRSESGNDAPHLLNVLRSLGSAERTLAGGLSFAKEKYLRPLQGLTKDWLSEADDGSPEFRLAASLAGIGAHRGGVPIRTYLEEVDITKGVSWSPGSTSAVWSRRSLSANLAAVFLRRQMESFRAGHEGVNLTSHCHARLDDVVAFMCSETDDLKFEERLGDLLWGLIGVDFSRSEQPEADQLHATPIPFEFGILRLLVEKKAFAVTSETRQRHWKVVAGAGQVIPPDPGVFPSLASHQSGSVTRCVDAAARRLKSSGMTVVGYRNRLREGKPLNIDSCIQPERLLAAMLFPLSDADLARIANSVLHVPEMQEN